VGNGGKGRFTMYRSVLCRFWHIQHVISAGIPRAICPLSTLYRTQLISHGPTNLLCLHWSGVGQGTSVKVVTEGWSALLSAASQNTGSHMEGFHSGPLWKCKALRKDHQPLPRASILTKLPSLPGVVVHICNPSTLGYLARPCSKTKQTKINITFS
jgi:hypothetical protein